MAHRTLFSTLFRLAHGYGKIRLHKCADLYPNAAANTVISSPHAHFLQLYTHFLHTYATDHAAQVYAARIPSVREEAARNYRHCIELDAAQQSITDAVLTGLLPHTDSESNRARGAWIHLTPAIHGDVVRLHERLGWAKAHEWEDKARAIFELVRTAVEQPERLPAACASFSALPYATGFQSGTLSPIFNALQPNLYLVVNRKTLAVINYFAGTSHSQQLRDYPAANAAGLELVDWVREAGGTPHIPPLRATDRFDLFCHWLVTVQQYEFHTSRCWQIRPGGDGQWDAWRNGGFVALGYDEFGDLSGLSRADFNERRAELLAQHPEWTGRDLNLLWTFARQLQEGDRLVAHDGAGEVLGIGTVSGFYYFVPDVPLGHCRPVVWIDLQRRRLDLDLGPRAFSALDAEIFDRLAHTPIAPERRAPAVVALPTSASDAPAVDMAAPLAVRERPPAYGDIPRDFVPPYSLAECAEATGFGLEQLSAWRDSIERKGQVIFYGPPGTGKSYIASHLARHLVGGGDGFLESVQFHSAYAYEDFVQGIRPVTEGAGTLTYRLVPGRFLQFCAAAAQRRGRCVLIIDEINRADPARVFGEVMHLLEYRGQAAALAAGGELSIPANLRIIGTMNTADRSIALVDVALRRRFAFLALYPDYALLRSFHVRAQSGFAVEGLITVLQRVNQQIGDPHHAVGITAFLRADLRATIAAIWRTEIEPYLEETFYDRLQIVESFRWQSVQAAIEEGK